MLYIKIKFFNKRRKFLGLEVFIVRFIVVVIESLGFIVSIYWCFVVVFDFSFKSFYIIVWLLGELGIYIVYNYK